MLEALLVPPAVLGFFWVLKRVAKPRPHPDDPTPEELKKEFGTNIWIGGFAACIASFVLVTGTTWILLRWLGSVVAPPAGSGVTVLSPSSWFWGLAAFAFGGASGLAAIQLHMKLRLGSRTEVFQRAVDRELGWRGRPVNLVLATIAFVFGLLLTTLGLGWHVQITSSKLTYEPFFGFGAQQHSFDDVQQILTAPVFKAPVGTNATRHYVVEFSDGSAWSTKQDPSDMDLPSRHGLAEYISERSGVPIREVPILKRELLYR